MWVIRGTACIPVVNVGSVDVVLYPHTVVCTLDTVNVVSLPSGVIEVPTGAAISSSQTVLPTVPPQMDDMDLSALSAEQFKALLGQYSSVFAAHDGDLGCTNLISHDIPLVDDVAVRQSYSRIPPSEYETVKEHISQLLSTQVIRESSSHYASSLVLVRKKDGSQRTCGDYRPFSSP